MNGLDHDGEFEEFFREYFARVKDFARRMGAPDPDEIAQETLTRMFVGWDSVDHDQPWVLLYVIARNLAHDEYRRRKTASFRELRPTDLRATSRDSPEEQAMLDELTRTVHDAMRRLSSSDRELIRLRVWDGLDYHELAARYRARESAIRQRYSRALRRLAAHITTGGLFTGTVFAALGTLGHHVRRIVLTPATAAGAAAAVVCAVSVGGWLPGDTTTPAGADNRRTYGAHPKTSSTPHEVAPAPSPSPGVRTPRPASAPTARQSTTPPGQLGTSIDVPPPDLGPGRKESHHIEVQTPAGDIVISNEAWATGHALDPACRSGIAVC